MSKILTPRTVFVAFLECEFRGGWEDEFDRAIEHGVEPEELNDIRTETADRFVANNDECELWIVRQDGLRKAWIFDRGSMVDVLGSTVKFSQGQVKDEIAIDENDQLGTRKTQIDS